MILLDNSSIRASIRYLCQQLSITEKKALDQQIVSLCHPYCQDAHTIGIYMPMSKEVDLRSLLTIYPNQCFCVPKVVDETTMEFVRIEETTKWKQGAFRIWEPVSSQFLKPEELDVIFVPLLAFTSTCDRLGQGRGYYDRYLDRCKALKIGVAYEFQRNDQFSVQPHDIPMDHIITPDHVYGREVLD